MLLIFMQKIIFISALFLEILQRYYKLIIWVLWASLAMPTKNNGVNRYKILMPICKQKINLIPQCFWQILHFTRSCNLWLAWNILGKNSRIKNLPDMDFFAVFASPRWTFIFSFFPLLSSFPLDYPVWNIKIKFLGLKIWKLEFTRASNNLINICSEC